MEQLVYGNDNFRVSAKVKELSGDGLECEIEQISLTDKNIDELYQSSQMGSFFAASKIIIVGLEQKLSIEEFKFQQWLINEKTAKIIFKFVGDLDLRLAINKILVKYCEVFHLADEEDDSSLILKKYVEENKIQINPEAEQMLVYNFENNAYAMINEVDKLSLISNVITTDVIENYSWRSTKRNVFQLATLVLGDDKVAAHNLFLSLVNEGVEPLVVNNLMYTQMKYFFVIKSLLSVGHSVSDIAFLTSSNTYRVQYAVEDCRGSDCLKIKLKMLQLVQNDALVKSGKLNAQTAVEMVILTDSQF